MKTDEITEGEKVVDEQQKPKYLEVWERCQFGSKRANLFVLVGGHNIDRKR